MKIKLNFTDEHIALIKALNFTQFDDSHYGIDNYSIWGGTYLWEQMAYILGYQGAMIPSTMEDPTGAKFYETVYTGIDENGKRVVVVDKEEGEKLGLEPINVLEHLKDLDAYMITNLKNIMDLLLQFCTEGIQAGVTYWAYDYQGIWHKEE